MSRPMRCPLSALLLALLVGACTHRADTEVTRLHKDSLPDGANYRLVPVGGMQADAEFGRFVALIRDRMASQGYREVRFAPAELVLEFGYKTSVKRKTLRTGTKSLDHSWNEANVNFVNLPRDVFDPLAPRRNPDRRAREETVYTTTLSIRIADASLDRTLFEGRAVNRSETAGNPAILRCLVDSIVRALPETHPTAKIEDSRDCDAGS